MLQIFASLFLVRSSQLSPSLHDFPHSGFRNGESHTRCKEYKYVDLLTNQCNSNNDTISTLYNAIPVIGNNNTSTTHNFMGRRNQNNDCHKSRRYLELAIEKLKENNPKLDCLALKYLVALFYDFIKKSRSEAVAVDIDFDLTEEYCFNSAVSGLVSSILNNRAYRTIFGIFLLRASKNLEDKIASVSSESTHLTLSELYAVYTKILIDFLLSKVNAERMLLDQNSTEVVTKYFIAIPSNNVTNGLANPILNADTWVNPRAIEK